MAHLELEAEVGAGNHVIKHTHAERSRRGGEKLQVRATKEEERHLKIRREGAETELKKTLARNYQGALCARACREGKPLKEGQVSKAHLWSLCIS